MDRTGVRITGAWVEVPGGRYAVKDLDDVTTVHRNSVSLTAKVVPLLSCLTNRYGVAS
jgi:hypothetical protein